MCLFIFLCVRWRVQTDTLFEIDRDVIHRAANLALSCAHSLQAEHFLVTNVLHERKIGYINSCTMGRCYGWTETELGKDTSVIPQHRLLPLKVAWGSLASTFATSINIFKRVQAANRQIYDNKYILTCYLFKLSCSALVTSHWWVIGVHNKEIQSRWIILFHLCCHRKELMDMSSLLLVNSEMSVPHWIIDSVHCLFAFQHTATVQPGQNHPNTSMPNTYTQWPLH